MKVLADYHHHDLWESLELLCDRLGWELYRPIGLEWFTEGYWIHERKFHGDAIAHQYLDPWGTDLASDSEAGRRHDLSHPHRWHKLLTLGKARDLRPDIVISTLADNHEGLARFAREVGATFGIQVGNVRFGPQDMAEDRWDLAAFGLVSGRLPLEPPKPHLVYHQEFSLADFRATPPPRRHQNQVHDQICRKFDNADGGKCSGCGQDQRFRISSFVQCYPETQWAYVPMTATAEVSPEFDWRVYGAYGQAPIDGYAAGNINVCSGVAEAMRDSDVAWHLKRWSDGYGHVFHNWFAVGRPMIGFRRYYADQLGGDLWLEGVNAWDVETRSRDDILAILRHFAEDEGAHIAACEAAAARFREVVDFDEEEQQIRALFAQVLP